MIKYGMDWSRNRLLRLLAGVVVKHGVINKIKSTLSLKVAERLAEHSFAITRVTARVLN